MDVSGVKREDKIVFILKYRSLYLALVDKSKSTEGLSLMEQATLNAFVNIATNDEWERG